jgi:L-2,4-diaminobutyrate decarboxylase
VHKPNDATVALREGIFDYARKRLEYDPAPLDAPQTLEFLTEHAGPTVTEEGLDGLKSLKLFENVLAPATISTDHPGYLSFIPCAPTEAAKLFDLIVSASAIYGGSWMEGAGAVYAENEVLHWLAREAGLPDGAGGVFVQGGTLGNLSALVAARHRATARLVAAGKPRPARWKFICSAEAHSSLKAAAAVMDVEIIKAAVDETGRLRGDSVQTALEGAGDGVFAIVATGGTTNFGIVDRLDEIGAIANRNDIWFHVDGAYGLAGILADVSRPLFAGLEQARN